MTLILLATTIIKRTGKAADTTTAREKDAAIITAREKAAAAETAAEQHSRCKNKSFEEIPLHMEQSENLCAEGFCFLIPGSAVFAACLAGHIKTWIKSVKVS